MLCAFCRHRAQWVDLGCYLWNKRLDLLKCFCEMTEISWTLSSPWRQGKAVCNCWEIISVCDSCEISSSWLNDLWLSLGLIQEKGASLFQILLDEPRMTIQAILFHEIADLTELSFSDHLVVVKIHVIICSSESQRISVAVASRRLIHRIRLFSSALHNLIFTDLYIHEPLHENTLEDSRDRLKSHSQ